jgi:hypothetical protein
LLSTPAIAQDQAAFATTDQSPFIQIYSLPSPAEAPVPGRGGWAWRFAFDVASNAIAEGPSAGERAVLSGESYRTSISLGYGLSERLTAAVMVPFVAHSSGMLDGFIRDWHDLFGLSNDRRDAVADYALNYSWAAQDDESFALESRSRGLGDIRLTLDRNLRDTLTDGRSLVLRSGVKLPTGSSSALRGSGSTDLSLQLLSTDRQALAAWNMSLSWMIGGLWLGDAEVLDERRRELVAIGSIGVSRPVWRGLVARVQLDGHSAFYDSDLRVLGASSVQITVGGSIALARADRIDFALVENLFTDSTPDFGVHVGWRDTF